MAGIRDSFDLSRDEVIFYFDGCTDDSQLTVANLMPEARLYVSFDDVYEVKANNKILEEAKNPVIILFQDDMVCHDKNIREKLQNIFDKRIPNLGLIGGRDGFELESTGFPEKPVNKISSWVHKPSGKEVLLEEGSFTPRTYLNRGPLVFTRKLLDECGYLDESYYPQWGDDMDYCARLRYKFGKCNVVFECDVESQLSWGSTRSKSTPLHKLTKGKHIRKNWDLFCLRWRDYIKK